MRLRKKLVVLILILVVGTLPLAACRGLPGTEGEADTSQPLPGETAINPLPGDSFTATPASPLPGGKITATRPPADPPAATLTPAPQDQLQTQQESSYPYRTQPGSPQYLPAFNHPEEGCGWVGLAGQVLNQDGAGLADIAVLVTGVIHGQEVVRAGLTAIDSSYGPGGYEVFLADRPGLAEEKVTVQLFNLESQPLSAPLLVALPADCEDNLLLINFQPDFDENLIFLPMVTR